MVEIALGGLAEQEVGRGGRNCARRPRRAGEVVRSTGEVRSSCHDCRRQAVGIYRLFNHNRHPQKRWRLTIVMRA